MINNHKLSIQIISCYALISFFLMSALFLAFGNLDSYYFNIKLLSQSDFISQLIIFLALFFSLVLSHKHLSGFDIHGSFVLSLLIFLLIFIIKAPAFSVIAGGIIISIPLVFFSIGKIKKEIKFSRNFYLYLLNLLIFFVIFVIFLTKINYQFPIYEGINIALVSHDNIFANLTIINLLLSTFVIIAINLFLLLNLSSEKNESKLSVIIIVVLTIIEVVALGIVMVYRTKSLNSPGFDFGIFTQMFYSMKNGNGMMTTIERSMPLSHLLVHVSPIYYLLLPVFMVFPYPETLQILQVLIVATGIIPLYLIAKHFNLNSKIRIVLSALYLFNPAIISSSFYDFHENSFLAPLLLFVIYFSLKQKWIGLLISFILTLMIKEDSSIYLVFIGLFFMFYSEESSTKLQKRNWLISSSVMIILSVAYFLLITSFLNSQGDGAMFWRYDNLNGYPDLGIIGIVLSAFQAPSYLLTTMFSPNKIYHLLLIFSSLGFIPLLNKNLSHYWLFGPLVIFNFATTYTYQYQFGFQYYYGSMVLLIFMAILVIKNNSERKIVNLHVVPRYTSLVISVIALMAIGFNTLIPRFGIVKYYFQSEEMYISMRNTLINIPSDKKILSSGFLVPYLADREVLYEYYYYNFARQDVEFDYIIIDRRSSQEYLDGVTLKVTGEGYALSELTTDYLLIFEPE
ncbi:MAG: DUF2079 domain-containing protein [Candidatus Izemoplasmatales bacterium]